jgi:hypothetical protein
LGTLGEFFAKGEKIFDKNGKSFTFYEVTPSPLSPSQGEGEERERGAFAPLWSALK